MPRGVLVRQLDDGFSEGKFEDDLAVVVHHLDDRAEQRLARAFATQQFQIMARAISQARSGSRSCSPSGSTISSSPILVLKKYLGMADSMGPRRPKWKPGNTHKFFIRCFCSVTLPPAASLIAEQAVEAIDPLPLYGLQSIQ